MSVESDLAKATSAQDLIPGDPDEVLSVASSMLAWGEALEEASTGFSHLDSLNWSGQAADAFRARFDPHPKAWADAANSFTSAGNAATDYGYALRAAQSHAKDALGQYDQAQQLTTAAKQEHQQQLTALQQQMAANPATSHNASTATIPFVDPGAKGRADAVSALQNARDNLHQAGETAAHAIRAATQAAPQKPSFWQRVGNDLENLGKDTANVTAQAAEDIYNNAIVPGVNGLADFGQAMLQHPMDSLKMIGGGLLFGASTALEGGGLLLDATGVGAAIGVPANVLGAAGMAAGAGLVADGFMDSVNNARNNDMNVMHSVSRATRQQDPGYGATPVRSAGAPEPPAGAARYDPEVASRVPAWGEPGAKTSGIIVKADGEELVQQSGIKGPAENLSGGTGSGLNSVLKTHVEAHAGAWIQPGENATLYINRLPCSPVGGVPGCETMLPRYIPQGATLTVYGPDNYVQVIQGARP